MTYRIEIERHDTRASRGARGAGRGLHAAAWLAAFAIAATGCGDDSDGDDATRDEAGNGAAAGGGSTTDGGTQGDASSSLEPTDPGEAELAAIDRFSEAAATLMVRTPDNGLPKEDAPIDFDQPPFITQGLAPDGTPVRYYNFDVQSTAPAPIYALFEEGADAPVDGQLNVVDVIPGDDGYNDFWWVQKVTVPEGYVANTITSHDQIEAMGLDVEPTDMLVNCPIVPDGSTAELRLNGDGPQPLHSGWYRGKLVKYFTFDEKALTGAVVPTSPIFVTFNVDPDQPEGGPPSGFVAESDGVQTHNVVATLPDDAAYSPLWSVQVYDNDDFDSVSDLTTVSSANVLATDVATVNCPIVSIGAD